MRGHLPIGGFALGRSRGTEPPSFLEHRGLHRIVGFSPGILSMRLPLSDQGSVSFYFYRPSLHCNKRTWSREWN